FPNTLAESAFPSPIRHFRAVVRARSGDGIISVCNAFHACPACDLVSEVSRHAKGLVSHRSRSIWHASVFAALCEKHLIRKLFASRGVFVWKNGLCSLYAFGVVAFLGSSQKCIRCDKKILRGPAGFIGGGYPLRTLPALDLRTDACITVFVRAKVGILIHDV